MSLFGYCLLFLIASVFLVGRFLIKEAGTHLKCPSCQGVLCTKDYSRFEVFDCPHCTCQFRGVHAEVSRRWLLIDWMNPFTAASFTNWDHTACPHCGIMVKLYFSWTHTGFDTPDTCRSCCNDLPTWEDDNGPKGIYNYINQHLKPTDQEQPEGQASAAKG